MSIVTTPLLAEIPLFSVMDEEERGDPLRPTKSS